MKSFALTALAIFAATASAETANPYLIQPNIESMVRVPIGGLNLVKDGTSGRLVLISDNARYVITDFTMRDMWNNNIKVESTETLTKFSDKLQRAMIPYDRMLYFTINADAKGANKTKGKKSVVSLPSFAAPKPILTAFVDPNCGYCRELFKMAAEKPEIETRFVIVPILGEDSEAKARQLSCAVSKGDVEKATKALVTHNYAGLPGKDDCKTFDTLRANLITANVMGIRGVPFMVAQDGTFTRGLVPDLVAFTTSAPTVDDTEILGPIFAKPADVIQQQQGGIPPAIPVTITPSAPAAPAQGKS